MIHSNFARHHSPKGTRPAYFHAHRSGALQQKIERAREIFKSCTLCPRSCEVNRYEETGICNLGEFSRVSSYFPHHGEEPCIRGSNGSGTIFFTSCNLRCSFCQNYDISHTLAGEVVPPHRLAGMMMELQDLGCHNINLVTPSHVVFQILEALPFAVEMGLRLPLVYNSSAYDSEESLDLLNGIIDIYMPDFKFWKASTSKSYMQAHDYPNRAQNALKKMHLQVGDLELDGSGIAVRGLLVRHLVMPDSLEETEAILGFLASELSARTSVNVMFQYHPDGKVPGRERFIPINRRPTPGECRQALSIARDLGLQVIS